jgi:Domain of unknown function (DUF4160)
MYYLDHNPPHFHVSYAGQEALLRISPCEILAGEVPGRVLALVVNWATLHEDALLDNWRRLRGDFPPVAIPPLE